jgi:hypothetical protein
MEVWKDIEGFNGRYQISNKCGIRSMDRIGKMGFVIKGRQLKPVKHPNGYYRISLSSGRGGKLYGLHRLMAQAFIPNPNNYPIINHIDHNPSNNTLENLEWCTHSHNTQVAYDCGRKVAPLLGRCGAQSVFAKKIVLLNTDGGIVYQFASIMDADQFFNKRRNYFSYRLQNKVKFQGLTVMYKSEYQRLAA